MTGRAYDRDEPAWQRGWARRRGARRSGVGWLDPGNARDLDAFLGEFLRLGLARLAVDALGLGLAVVDAPRLVGKARADIVAIGLDMAAHRQQRGAQLGRAG